MNEILNDPAKTIFLVLTLGIGIELLVASFFYVSTRRFVDRAHRATGTVVGRQNKADGLEELEISFTDVTGAAQRGKLHVGQAWAAGKNEIEILSDLHNPSRIKVNSFAALWLLPLALYGAVMMGVIMLVILTVMGIAKAPF